MRGPRTKTVLTAALVLLVLAAISIHRFILRLFQFLDLMALRLEAGW